MRGPRGWSVRGNQQFPRLWGHRARKKPSQIAWSPNPIDSRLGSGNGELVFKGHRLPVLQDEKVVGMDGGEVV